MEYYL
jgi:hypothetical protein